MRNFDAHTPTLNRFAQMIARDEILDSNPTFYYDVNNAADRSIAEELKKNLEMEKMLELVGRNKLVIDLKQRQNSPFSKDLLLRILTENLIDAEHWRVRNLEETKRVIALQPATNFHSLYSDMIRHKKLSYAHYPDNLEGWKGIEDHLLDANAVQVQQDKKKTPDASQDIDIFDYLVSQGSQGSQLLPIDDPLSQLIDDPLSQLSGTNSYSQEV